MEYGHKTGRLTGTVSEPALAYQYFGLCCLKMPGSKEMHETSPDTGNKVTYITFSFCVKFLCFPCRAKTCRAHGDSVLSAIAP
jgi:hypothetical protein